MMTISAHHRAVRARFVAPLGKHSASFPVIWAILSAMLNLKVKTSKKPEKTHGKQALWQPSWPYTGPLLF